MPRYTRSSLVVSEPWRSRLRQLVASAGTGQARRTHDLPLLIAQLLPHSAIAALSLALGIIRVTYTITSVSRASKFKKMQSRRVHVKPSPFKAFVCCTGID